MSSGDKMAPFLASEMAWVCHVIFFNYVYIYTNYSILNQNFYVLPITVQCLNHSIPFKTMQKCLD